MLAEPTRGVVLALVLPATCALLATMCTATPPAASPSSAAPASTSDASASAWGMPGVPLLAPHTLVLLQPPPAGPDAAVLRAIAPDPKPLSTRGQWVYDLRYDKGELFLRGVHRVELPAPRETPRMMGRFALELYSGPTLLERVRFDFPGLGAPDKMPPAGPDGSVWRPLHDAPFAFTAKLSTRIGVMFPATPRGTTLELWDRATDRRWPLPWPASEMTADPGDAGGGDT